MRRTIAAAIAIAASSLAAAADEAAVDAKIVADQVRAQGFACAEPATAVRDEANSKPDQAAYVLTCADASYNVRLVPDMAAQVTPAQ
jgi:hypothetical protein